MTTRIIKQLSLFFATALTLVFAPNAHAQFGGLFNKQTSDATAAAGVTMDTFGKSTADATGQVLAARITFLDAQAKLMEALGLKTDSVVKASEALRAKEGAATSTGDKVKALKDSSKTTAAADKEIDESMAKSQTLSAESKAKYAEGAGKFIQGVLLEKEQIVTITKLVDQGKSLAASAGWTEKLKVAGLVKPVTELSSMVPGDVSLGTSTLGKILSFAKSQNITDIPNTDKATASLGDLN